jgi:2-oxoglutarate ferredoxin oxidoreductase subunit delta
MKGYIKIDVKRCKGCRYCIGTCPSGVISVSNRFNKDGYFPACAEHLEKCTGCGMCATVCPDRAITVFSKRKGI